MRQIGDFPEIIVIADGGVTESRNRNQLYRIFPELYKTRKRNAKTFR